MQLQQARVTFYRKRSAEILSSPLPPAPQVREDPSSAMALVFTQTECSQPQPTVSSSLQARLTGGRSLEPFLPSHRRFFASRRRRFPRVAETTGGFIHACNALEESSPSHSAQRWRRNARQVAAAASAGGDSIAETNLLPPASSRGTLGGKSGGDEAGVAARIERECVGAATDARGVAEPAAERNGRRATTRPSVPRTSSE